LQRTPLNRHGRRYALDALATMRAIHTVSLLNPIAYLKCVDPSPNLLAQIRHSLKGRVKDRRIATSDDDG